MHTVTRPPGIPPDPDPPDRIRVFREAVDEAAQWYAGGLPPEPWPA